MYFYLIFFQTTDNLKTALVL